MVALFTPPCTSELHTHKIAVLIYQLQKASTIVTDASLGVVGEHINRRLKIFRILKQQYRNRRNILACDAI